MASGTEFLLVMTLVAQAVVLVFAVDLFPIRRVGHDQTVTIFAEYFFVEMTACAV